MHIVGAGLKSRRAGGIITAWKLCFASSAVARSLAPPRSFRRCSKITPPTRRSSPRSAWRRAGGRSFCTKCSPLRLSPMSRESSRGSPRSSVRGGGVRAALPSRHRLLCQKHRRRRECKGQGAAEDNARRAHGGDARLPRDARRKQCRHLPPSRVRARGDRAVRRSISLCHAAGKINSKEGSLSRSLARAPDA